MRRYLFILITVLAIHACGESEDTRAAALLSDIQTLYEQGKYGEALDSIKSLRTKFPKAIKSRETALKIWQEASLKMAQTDIAKTDSALQATIAEMNGAKSIYERNMLMVRRDSLQVRYDALCGTVRVIHKRQKEQ